MAYLFRALRTASSFPTQHSVALRINPARLNLTLHDTCQWGEAMRYGPAPTQTGMRRLSLDDNDAKVRRWFEKEMKTLGCCVKVDNMGNMFAVRPGKKEGAPVAIGSHFDTQPTGGRYDGILGMMAGVEFTRTLEENNYETEFPTCVVNWTNEEGARFPKSIVSSAAWAGDVPLRDAWMLADVADQSLTMKSELSRIGFLGDMECGWKSMPLAGHFELHIEQGPILEGLKKSVGVVLGGQSYRWWTINVHGKDCHTGTTPFSNRSDALLCAARIMLASNRLAKENNGLASTGILTLESGSTNVIPSLVKFSLDIRHPSTSRLHEIDKLIRAEAERIAAEDCELGCKLEWTMDTDSPAVEFHQDAVQAVRESAIEEVGLDMVEELFSGAGHDSCAVSKRCPTAMVFVPSKDGLSHNPLEYTSPEDCATGAQVILDAVLRFDRRRTS